jgi:hypothetical protein
MSGAPSDERLGLSSILVTLHYITFPGSKVSQNDCRMWNKSYRYKDTYTVQLKHSKSTYTPELLQFSNFAASYFISDWSAFFTLKRHKPSHHVKVAVHGDGGEIVFFQICLELWCRWHEHIGLRILTGMTMKNMIFWLLTLFSSERAQCFRETYHLHHQGWNQHVPLKYQ